MYFTPERLKKLAAGRGLAPPPAQQPIYEWHTGGVWKVGIESKNRPPISRPPAEAHGQIFGVLPVGRKASTNVGYVLNTHQA